MYCWSLKGLRNVKNTMPPALLLVSSLSILSCACAQTCGVVMPYTNVQYLSPSQVTLYNLTNPCTTACTSGYYGDLCAALPPPLCHKASGIRQGIMWQARPCCAASPLMRVRWARLNLSQTLWWHWPVPCRSRVNWCWSHCRPGRWHPYSQCQRPEPWMPWWWDGALSTWADLCPLEAPMKSWPLPRRWIPRVIVLSLKVIS